MARRTLICKLYITPDSPLYPVVAADSPARENRVGGVSRRLQLLAEIGLKVEQGILGMPGTNALSPAANSMLAAVAVTAATGLSVSNQDQPAEGSAPRRTFLKVRFNEPSVG
jgi:hypothetical protein